MDRPRGVEIPLTRGPNLPWTLRRRPFGPRRAPPMAIMTQLKPQGARVRKNPSATFWDRDEASNGGPGENCSPDRRKRVDVLGYIAPFTSPGRTVFLGSGPWCGQLGRGSGRVSVRPLAPEPDVQGEGQGERVEIRRALIRDVDIGYVVTEKRPVHRHVPNLPLDPVGDTPNLDPLPRRKPIEHPLLLRGKHHLPKTDKAL
jgi:hypothetical protein